MKHRPPCHFDECNEEKSEASRYGLQGAVTRFLAALKMTFRNSSVAVSRNSPPLDKLRNLWHSVFQPLSKETIEEDKAVKCLLSASTVTEEGILQLCKSMLEEAGIPCMIQNEELCDIKGAVPFTECFPELWISEDGDFAKAIEIVSGWEHSPDNPHPAWSCPHCEELNEGQFTTCWNCGNEQGET